MKWLPLWRFKILQWILENKMFFNKGHHHLFSQNLTTAQSLRLIWKNDKLKKPHKYTHSNIELLKASNSEKMDHNIEWGKLYFLIASSKGLAVIILMKLHHFFSLFLCPFYVFVQKGSSQCTFLVSFSFTVYVFGELFFHSVHFGEFFFSVRFGEFSICLV